MATVKVRILVAVDDTGKWVSHGSATSDDEECREWIPIDDLNEHLSYFWLEAQVPIPAQQTLTARVCKDQKPAS